jgi:hypothetical protein
MATVRHLNELQRFHVRDLSKLTEGARVLIGHVPPLTDEVSESGSAFTSAEFATVLYVEDLSYNDLHGTDGTVEWMTVVKTMLQLSFAADTNLQPQYHFASDYGVVPEDNGDYNDTDFIVRIVDLEASDVELVLKPSQEYQAKLKLFNSLFDGYNYDSDADVR